MAALTVAALPAACSDNWGSSGRISGQATSTTAVALQPAGAAGQPLRRALGKATLVRVKAAGVVLADEYPNELCGFWPFANYLIWSGPGRTTRRSGRA